MVGTKDSPGSLRILFRSANYIGFNWRHECLNVFRPLKDKVSLRLSCKFWSAALVMREALLKEMMGDWDLSFKMKSTSRMESFSLH